MHQSATHSGHFAFARDQGEGSKPFQEQQRPPEKPTSIVADRLSVGCPYQQVSQYRSRLFQPVSRSLPTSKRHRWCRPFDSELEAEEMPLLRGQTALLQLWQGNEIPAQRK